MESVSFESLFCILPYGVVSKNISFVFNIEFNIFSCNFLDDDKANVVSISIAVNVSTPNTIVNPI